MTQFTSERCINIYIDWFYEVSGSYKYNKTGIYWYKINGAASGKTVTIQYGPLEATNT